jgi:hypothetical protein
MSGRGYDMRDGEGGARAVPAPGSHPSDHARSGHGASRFDPSRVTGLGLGKSNDWHTPAAVFAALGCRFDLDVAAPRDGPLHVPTSRWLSSGALERDWEGFVWMNPPFGGRGALSPWLTKFFDHGNGIALTPDRTSAPWFQGAWRRADAVMFARKTPFLLANGEKAGSPAFGTALWASGPRAVVALLRAERLGFGILALPRDSGRHRDSGGDAFAAPGAACQSGPNADSGIAQPEAA